MNKPPKEALRAATKKIQEAEDKELREMMPAWMTYLLSAGFKITDDIIIRELKR